MKPEDQDYFELRAEQERKRAATCSDPAVAGVHRTLARRYTEMIQETEAAVKEMGRSAPTS